MVQITIDLNKITPISTVLKSNSNTKMKVKEPNNSGTNVVKTNMNMELKLESK